MSESRKILPRWLLTGSIEWIAGFDKWLDCPSIHDWRVSIQSGDQKFQPLSVVFSIELNGRLYADRCDRLVAMVSLMTGLW
jgi:hypothetical protein